jgi:hypothetical protein
MAINPELITTIRVDQLPDETLSLTNLFPHTVGTDLKSATIQELVDLVATAIGVSGGVGYLAISVTDGQQLPDVPELPGFFLCGAGTYLNINGYPDVICTDELNAVMSLTDHWGLAVGIPIVAEVGVQSVTGSAVDNTDPLNPIINATGTPTLQEVINEGNTISSELSIITLGGEEESVNVRNSTVPEIYSSVLNEGFFSNDVNKGSIYSSDNIINYDSITHKNLQINYPTSIVGTNKVQTFQDANGTLALTTDITTPTLQEVLDNNHDLVDGNFFAGEGAGDGNTEINVNAFGGNAANGNTGMNVNALGNSAGIVNSFNNVNLFGNSAYADEDGQTVLSKDGAIMARISTTDLTATRKYNLPDADGTIALTSDITTPTLQQVTDEGAITNNSIIVTDNSENETALQYNGINFNDLDEGGNTLLRFLNTSAINQEIEIRGLGGTMALTSDIPTLVAGTNISIDDTDPLNPIISSSGGGGGVTSVGLTMPSAFSVTNSPITSSGDIAVTGAGLVSQYVRGDGTLANFPASTGGGASISFYLNGSVSQGTIGGVAFREMDRTPILGAGTDFTINANGYIQSFITDANVPNLLEIPAGNWNFETYFSASSGGGSPSFYVELYKWNGTTLSLIASNSATPEGITNGTAIDAYFSALAVPQTTLLATDRLAVRIYVTHSGRTITLHTEDNHLCQVITTFTTGLTALNGLTTQVQNLAVGTSGTDFAISSATDTHTFNLPTASATNRGALSSTDWSTFNGKQNALSYTPYRNVQTSQTALTGTTAETIVFTATIPAGAFNSVDVLKVLFGANKTTGLGAYTLRLRVNTTNTISGAPTIATYTGTASSQVNVIMRNYNLNGGNLYGLAGSASSLTDIVVSGSALGSNTLNPANTFYLFATVQLGNSGDSIIGNMFTIHN